MDKRIVEVGDVFGTWEVIGLEVNDKKYNYNYICKCECGNKRTIRKDKLVNFTFAKCDKCLSYGVIDMKTDIIKKFWSYKLNGAMIHGELDINRQYFWECPEGHIYKNTIMLLTDMCPKCAGAVNRDKHLERLREQFNKTVDYIDKVGEQVFDNINIKIDESNMVMIVEFEHVNLLITPKIHKSFNSAVHRDKTEHYETLSFILNIKKSLTRDSKEHIFLDIDLTDKDYVKINSILGIVKNKSL